MTIHYFAQDATPAGVNAFLLTNTSLLFMVAN